MLLSGNLSWFNILASNRYNTWLSYFLINNFVDRQLIMKRDKTRHLLAVTISIGCVAYLLSACDSKENALAHYNQGVAY